MRSAAALCAAWRAQGMRIALVPTMGALHAGHMSLIAAARRRADKVVVSIFVNPTQFGPAEDFAQYPRPFAADCRACATAGVDLIFAPQANQMYPPNFSTWVEETALAQHLCGPRRPGHFRGVCTVVLKLFNIIQPHLAFFGQKDAQQALIIRRMVRDLNVPIKIIVCPIVRERDGLAMSSRNAYLSAEQRAVAPRIYAALQRVKAWHAAGWDCLRIRRALEHELASLPGARLDYAALVDEQTLEDVTQPHRGQHILVAVAVFIGTTRLIDNLRLRW
ncbi:MAG: pantoate--beta-alanine ligase [bacterium]|nr:pantoate--beta-alanine ligase [bacterium]